MSTGDLVIQWRQIASQLRAFGADAQATALERAASDLARALEVDGDEFLSLATAAMRSGYNADSLRRKARLNEIPHVRRGRRLFFRAGDLPRKASRVDELSLAGYDPAADARTVAAERARGE